MMYMFLSCSVRSVVIDCAPISFLDADGVKALKQLVVDFDKCNVQVVFAAMTGTYMYIYSGTSLSGHL